MTNVVDFTKPRAANAAADPWPEPEPFDALNLPAFPAGALSPWLRGWAIAEAEATQTPVDLPACVALGATALAVSRSHHVCVREGWREPCNLYIVSALPPGERKSAVFSDATRPVYDYQSTQADILGPRIAARLDERGVLEDQIAAARAAAARHKQYEGVNAMDAIRELRARLDVLPEISAPRLVADDATPEALARLMATTGERIGVLSAEGGPFEVMAGRYSERPNFEIFLKSHPGDHHVVDRVRSTPIHLEHPLLTMVLTVQPSVIAGLASREGFRGRGLLARFLYSTPRTALGTRAVNPASVPEPMARAYREALDALLTAGGDDHVLRLSSEAGEARAAFQQELEPRLGPDRDLHHVADWGGKLTGAIARIAGVLHVADHAREAGAPPEEIPAPTWARAQEIGVYFLAHSVAALGSMGADEGTELARRVWEWVVRNNVSEFSERDAYRPVNVKPDGIAAPLAKLVERNLVRALPAAPHAVGRPPSPRYAVNPRARA